MLPFNTVRTCFFRYHTSSFSFHTTDSTPCLSSFVIAYYLLLCYSPTPCLLVSFVIVSHLFLYMLRTQHRAYFFRYHTLSLSLLPSNTVLVFFRYYHLCSWDTGSTRFPALSLSLSLSLLWLCHWHWLCLWLCGGFTPFYERINL